MIFFQAQFRIYFDAVKLGPAATKPVSKPVLRSPLVFAASNGRKDLVEHLVQRLGFDVNDTEEDSGLSPLAGAILAGDKVEFQASRHYLTKFTP